MFTNVKSNDARHTAYLAALARIRRAPELDRFGEDALLDNWDSIDQHYDWLITAPIDEIVDWAEIAVGAR